MTDLEEASRDLAQAQDEWDALPQLARDVWLAMTLARRLEILRCRVVDLERRRPPKAFEDCD